MKQNKKKKKKKKQKRVSSPNVSDILMILNKNHINDYCPYSEILKRSKGGHIGY